jgi:endonuclease-3
MRETLPVPEILDRLEALHGKQEPVWPTEPYQFLVWWHSGYPASDAACAKGWNSLKKNIGVQPAKLLAASPDKLASALKPGGMVPELRAMRLKEVAARVKDEFHGDLSAALSSAGAKARALLKKFPGIADPGADRILLFGGIQPLAAVPSNSPQVLVRIMRGKERENYGVNYKETQEALEAGLPRDFAPRTRAYLLLKQHGQEICKRTSPKCTLCPLSANCAYFAGHMRGRAL